MIEWIATFGGGHTHPLTGESLRDCYVRVPAPSYSEAHDAMVMSVFGRQWAFLYRYANVEDIPDGVANKAHRAAGVRVYNLREVPWIPPSAVALTLWAVFEVVPLTATDWVDKVVRPAEVAHQLAVTEALKAVVPEPAS